ncbi:non-ribosomal peptide synthetase [Rhizobium sullae]|uniref:non-ribosomal peptide synthetase n=1 Tax=Rhizobium sullae TaxID=50338 RepID=UPI000B34C615|nr:non-ribosomal peptide synthetase [Rhizobium sullae]
MTDLAFCEPNELSTAMHYDRDRSLHEIVHQQAQIAPRATALVFGDRSVTYGELDRLSDGLAARLEGFGVGRGDVIGLLLPRSLDTIICMLAILKAGGAYLPLDPAYPHEHLDYVLAECEPKVVFVDAASIEKISSASSERTNIVDANTLLLEVAVAPTAARPMVEIGGGDLAYVMFTSGSTGRPKGVAIPHRGISRIALDQNYHSLTRRDVVLHASTISFDASTWEIWCALLNGCALVIMPDVNFSVAGLCQVIRNYDVTSMLLTTGLFHLFADYSDRDLPSLRHVFFGGDVASAAHARRFLDRHPGCILTNAYGPTETTVLATAFTIPQGFSAPELPIGMAVAHTSIRILDETLRELPAGIEGQLAISGDGLAVGYFNRPELTEEKFVMVETRDGPQRCYLTGDLAIMGVDGMVAFKGRRDRQVKINGKRIELDEIEAALRRDSRLADAIVVCHTQSQSLKHVVAYLRPCETSAGKDPDLAGAVMATLRRTLPAHMIPNSALVLDSFPMTPGGKVDRSKLSLPPAEPEGSIREAPESQVEAVLVNLWREALGREEIALNRNFFDLGGTSLQLMRVHGGLEAHLRRGVDVVMLFKHPTIRELALFLNGKASDSLRSASAARRAALQRKTMSQFRRSSS